VTTAAEALEFVKSNHRAVLVTRRRDGRPQVSPVTCGVDDQGYVVVSSRETAVKVKNLRRNPEATLCVFADGFYGPWVFVTGEASIVSLPEAMDGLVAYYRSIAGEHPDWDDYRGAMERERRVLIRVPADEVGPNISG
jgi:PPOX class probable F420-dependent enzyme